MRRERDRARRVAQRQQSRGRTLQQRRESRATEADQQRDTRLRAMRIVDHGRRANETAEERGNKTSSTTCSHRLNGARQQERRFNETEEESKIRLQQLCARQHDRTANETVQTLNTSTTIQVRSVVNQWGSSFPSQVDLYMYVHVHYTLCSECTIKLDAVTEPCVFF